VEATKSANWKKGRARRLQKNNREETGCLCFLVLYFVIVVVDKKLLLLDNE
jgi:hypothetical protein